MSFTKPLSWGKVSQIPEVNFRGYLVEMETTNQQKSDIRTIIQKLIDGDKSWFDEKGIVTKDAGSYWVLNYNQAGGDNEFNRTVRGMVVRKPEQGFHGDLLGLIKSFPFMRFFNRQETGRAANVDFSNAEMLEKLDGTMVGVFFPDGNPTDPHWHTRKMLSSHKPDMDYHITGFHGGTYNFLPLIGSYVKKIRFSDEDVDFTYVFEFIHAASMVWTKYTPEQHGLYLLGARNVKTHKELTEDELDATAKRLSIPRPRRWDAVADDAQIASMMADVAKTTSGFEGFIFRDRKTGDRVKLKDADYVKFHHMLDELSFKNLLGKVLEGEEDEIRAYFPSAIPKIETIKKNYDRYINAVADEAVKWTTLPLDRKGLALKVNAPDGVKDKMVRNLIYHNIGNGDREDLRHQIDQLLRRTALGQGKQAGSPKSVLDLIGLEDDEAKSPTEEL